MCVRTAKTNNIEIDNGKLKIPELQLMHALKYAFNRRVKDLQRPASKRRTKLHLNNGELLPSLFFRTGKQQHPDLGELNLSNRLLGGGCFIFASTALRTGAMMASSMFSPVRAEVSM